MGIVGSLTSALVPAVVRLLSGVFDQLAVPAVRFLAGQGKLPAAAAAGLPRVVIVGDGGAGKSTLLKQMLARAGSAGRVPVWVPLAGLAGDGPLTTAVLVDHLVRQAHAALGLDDVNDAFFRALIDEGRLAVGFDALDECGSLARRQKVRGLIVEVAREWKRCQVFVTSRPDALRETPLPLLAAHLPTDQEAKAEEFFAFEPVPFGRDDVGPFLKAAFGDDGTLAQTLLARTGIEALLETPLTLTLVGLVARTARAGLPATRTPLFAQCLKTVCDTWEDAKGGPPSDGLDPAQRLDALRRLGWEAQQLGGDRLGARAARRALARAAALAPRDEAIVNGLARRNLLLRAETSDAGDVQQIRFSHPQFREYLAGAHLAEQFALDAKAAAAAMASHWFDSGWLEVLRFAVATVEDDAELRDALLRTILAVDDPYRDLLRRPEFLVARLAARLAAADAALLAQVVATLEHAALQEPALRDEAARLLLGLTAHAPARPAIRRFAEGAGIASAFAAADGAAYAAQLDAFRWRLRAIEALAQTEGAPVARTLLQRLATPEPRFVLEACELRVRLHDRDGALATWKACFDADPDARKKVAASMDRAAEGAQFDAWLQACVARADATVGDVELARQRDIAADYATAWRRLFEAALQLLHLDEPRKTLALQVVSDAVLAALDAEVAVADARGAQVALLAAALREPRFTPIVGTRVLGRFPELRDDAVAELLRYVLRSLEPGAVLLSRAPVEAAVHALCDEPDDAGVVPALRELLRRFDPEAFWPMHVAASLARRGRGREALEDLAPMLALPPDADDRRPDPQVRRRHAAWELARALDWPATRLLLDAMYRQGDPQAAAERLMGLWNVSGVAAVARDWFAVLAADENGRKFLHALTTHERDTFFTDSARHALYGGVFDDGGDDDPEPWTLEHYEKAFAFALETGGFVDERDNEEDASVRNLLGLLGDMIAAGDAAAALRHADAWVQRSLQDQTLAVDEKADRLAEQLQGLARRGLHGEHWVAPVAAFARTVAPADRVGLVEWLNAAA